MFGHDLVNDLGYCNFKGKTAIGCVEVRFCIHLYELHPEWCLVNTHSPICRTSLYTAGHSIQRASVMCHTKSRSIHYWEVVSLLTNIKGKGFSELFKIFQHHYYLKDGWQTWYSRRLAQIRWPPSRRTSDSQPWWTYHPENTCKGERQSKRKCPPKLYDIPSSPSTFIIWGGTSSYAA